MKKSLIALILLSGFIGCDRNSTPITVRNEQNIAETPEPAGNHDAKDTATIADHLSFMLEKPSPKTIIALSEQSEAPEESQEPDETQEAVETEKPVEIEQSEETVASTPISFLSKKDGFSVLMPSVPTEMSLDPTNSTHVRIYQAQVQDGLVQYNVFCHFFKKKILNSETIRTYLDSLLPDRLVGVEKGQITRKTLTKFKGFDAKEFEYVSAEGDAEFIYKAIAFLIDGDSISLTMVHPKDSTPTLPFDEFTKSFELLPLEPLLWQDDWIDERLGLRFTPPAGMSLLNKERNHNGLVVMFANEAGHTIGILDATVAYPNITWSDVQSQLSEMKDCGDGFYEKIIPGTPTKSPTIQLLRCAGNGERIFLIQAYAPQKTFFRSVEKFKAAMKSFSFDD